MMLHSKQFDMVSAPPDRGRSGRRRLLLLSALALVAAGLVGAWLALTVFKREVQTVVYDAINKHTGLFLVTTDDLDAYIAGHSIMPATSENASGSASGPLRVHPTNPRYFADAEGSIVYLTGSHTWLNLQDGVLTDPPPAFDYPTYLDFLEAHHHNFFRLWTWEQAKWVVEWGSPYYFAPMPYLRTGPGDALDGKPKFDLTQFDQTYFDRMRARVIEAGDRGMYVSIMLFNGWSTDYPKGFYELANPWVGHPYNAANNVNGIDGDPSGDSSGQETQMLWMDEVVALQEAYVAKVIDTVNDLDNVLYEISNESHGDSDPWQYHMINFIKDYEADKPKQHPVGMTVEWPNGSNDDLFNSPADWISPNNYFDPPAADGRKVIIADTDHIWGIGGDRTWVWVSFVRGINPIFMDQYDDSYKLNGGGYDMNNANDVSLRLNMGYTRMYAERMDLAHMTPRGELCSTGYCLAKPTANAAAYLVYAPDGGEFTVDLTATAGDVHVEWFNPATGATSVLDDTAAGAVRTFTPPFTGDAVLYLYQDQAPVEAPNKTYLPLVEHPRAHTVAAGVPCGVP